MDAATSPAAAITARGITRRFTRAGGLLLGAADPRRDAYAIGA